MLIDASIRISAIRRHDSRPIPICIHSENYEQAANSTEYLSSANALNVGHSLKLKDIYVKPPRIITTARPRANTHASSMQTFRDLHVRHSHSWRPLTLTFWRGAPIEGASDPHLRQGGGQIFHCLIHVRVEPKCRNHCVHILPGFEKIGSRTWVEELSSPTAVAAMIRVTLAGSPFRDLSSQLDGENESPIWERLAAENAVRPLPSVIDS